MEFLLGVVVLTGVVFAIEYRFRNPDRLIICEGKRGFAERKSRLYPRHLSLVLPRTTHAFQVRVEAIARGNLDVRVVLAASVAAAPDHLDALVRMGGWRKDAVERAAKELEGQLHSHVKEYTEQFTVETLSSQKLLEYLQQKMPASRERLGIEVVSLVLLSFGPIEARIVEALQQQEHARILERTETLQQHARIAAAKTKLKADEEIALLEHALDIKKFEMKKNQIEQESVLADIRVDDDIRRQHKQLVLDREEFEMLKSNPELLMLTPQAARLAEASQGLRNARTIVSLSPQEFAQGSDLLGMFQRLLQNALGTRASGKETTKSK
jgi:cell division protein FtsL